MKLVFRLLLVVLFIFFGCGENKSNKSMKKQVLKEKKMKMKMGYSGYWIVYNNKSIKNFFNLPAKPRGYRLVFDFNMKEKKGCAIFLYESKKYDFSINKVKRNEFELIYKKNKLSVHLKKDDTADDILYLFFIKSNDRSKIKNWDYDGSKLRDELKSLDDLIKELRENNYIAEVEEDIVENCGFDPTTDPTIVKDEKENKEKK